MRLSAFKVVKVTRMVHLLVRRPLCIAVALRSLARRGADPDNSKHRRLSDESVRQRLETFIVEESSGQERKNC